MKIFVYSTLYPPSIGGMERVMSLLVREFLVQGHQVTLVTPSLPEDLGISKEWAPSYAWIPMAEWFRWIRAAATADAILQANISLPASWILKVVGGQRLTVVHHTWYAGGDGERRIRDWLKIWTTRFCNNIGVSSAIQNEIVGRSEVIPNPVDIDLFRRNKGGSSEKCPKVESELLFVGRLVSDKGVDLLLEALARTSSHLRLRVVGDGPERMNLETLATKLGISDRVAFLGSRSGEELAKVYWTSQTVVIPSRWAEPFGVVGLEALIAGCAVLAASRDGLREALGDHAVYFEPEDTEALAALLERGGVRAHSDDPTGLEYAQLFTPHVIALRYLKSMGIASCDL